MHFHEVFEGVLGLKSRQENKESTSVLSGACHRSNHKKIGADTKITKFVWMKAGAAPRLAARAAAVSTEAGAASLPQRPP